MVHYIKSPKGKVLPVDYKSGKVLEQHEIWDKPIERPPEQKKVSEPFIPFIPYEKAPEYLVPKGDGWYGDPPEAPDPSDCKGAFGDISPQCGGNPVDVQSIWKLAPFSYEPKIRFDNCNIWAQLGGSLFGVNMPPKTIAFRLEGECRNEPPPPPLPAPERGGATYFDNRFRDVDPSTRVIAFFGYGATDPGMPSSGGWIDYYCPGIPYRRFPSDSNLTQPIISGKYRLNSTETVTTIIHYDSGGFLKWIGVTSNGHPVYERYPTGGTTIINASLTAEAEIEYYRHSDYYFDVIYKGRWGLIQGYVDWLTNTANQRFQSFNFSRIVNYLVKEDCSSPRDKRKLPPPPREDEEEDDCCMSCQQQNELLRQVLAQVKKNGEAVGTKEFPATLPKVLNNNDSSNVSVENVPQFLKRLAIYFDGLVGEQPVKIKIQDTDATQEGDQSKEMVFDNISEMLAEQFGLSMNANINSELIVQLLVKTLTELSITRKQLHNTQSAVEAMQSYFGYDCREQKEKVPFSISIPKTDKLGTFTMDEFIKNSEQEIEVWKLQKSEIGSHKKRFLLLEKAAAIIQARFWKKLPGGTDTKDAMSKILKKQNAVINSVDNHEDELQDWLEKFENGFTSEGGYVGDVSKPWGDDYESRPKTKIIGKVRAEVQDPDVKPPTT